MWSSVPTVLGSAMMAGFGPVLVALIVLGDIFVFRIPREEKLMTEAFGEQYVRYQHDVPRLVPFLRI